MFPAPVTVLLVLICATCAVLAGREGASTAAAVLWTAAAWLVYGRLRFGSISRAWAAASSGDMAAARRLAAGAPFDGRLLSHHYRAGRHLLLSVAALEDGDLDAARTSAEHSLALESTEHNRAMGHACLARVALAEDDVAAARLQLARATERRFKPSLRGALDEIRAELQARETGAA